MKHLKRFLESIDCDEVDDIFLEISDYGFNVQVFDEEREIADETIYRDLSWDDFNDSIRIFEMLSIIITKKGKPFLINADSEESNELRNCILRVLEIYKDYELTIKIGYKQSEFGGLTLRKEILLLKNNRFVYKHNTYERIDYPIVELTMKLERIT
jgi:hypothetical protein